MLEATEEMECSGFFGRKQLLAEGRMIYNVDPSNEITMA